MEKALVGAHAMFHVHLQENLVNERQFVEVFSAFSTTCFHEGKQEWIVEGVICRFLNQAVFIESGNSFNGISHHPVKFWHHGVTQSQTLPGITLRMTAGADCDHFVAFLLPCFLGQPCHIELFYCWKDRSWFTGFRIKNCQCFENGDLIGGPLLVFRQWQTNAKESPGGMVVMISVCHMAILAFWCSSALGKITGLFSQVSCTMLGA